MMMMMMTTMVMVMVMMVVIIALARHFTLPGTLSGRCHYYTHSTDEGTEGQRSD